MSTRVRAIKPRRSTHRSQARFLGRVVEGARPALFPGFIELCNPVARKAPPAGDAWVHEIKHDGYRAQAQFNEGGPRIYTKAGNDWAARMPTIAASLASLPVNNVILDGELVAVDTKGRPVFYDLPAALSARSTRIKARLVYYAFDLLHLDGFDLTGAALIDRKRVLEALLFNTQGVQLIKYVEHIDGEGATVLEHACALGLEGIVSKRASSPYRSGARGDWIKTKCSAWKVANRDRFELMGKK